MKKRALALVLIFTFSLFANNLFAEDTTPQPYNKDEMPQTLQDVRRFEIITLGALPFVTLDVTIVYSIINSYKKSSSGSDSVSSIFAINSFTQDEQLDILKKSIGISLCVGISDLGARHIKRAIAKNKVKKENRKVLVVPLDEDPGAIKLENPFENESESDDIDVVGDEVESDADTTVQSEVEFKAESEIEHDADMEAAPKLNSEKEGEM